jgi:hypothetical protein
MNLSRLAHLATTRLKDTPQAGVLAIRGTQFIWGDLRFYSGLLPFPDLFAVRCIVQPPLVSLPADKHLLLQSTRSLDIYYSQVIHMYPTAIPLSGLQLSFPPYGQQEKKSGKLFKYFLSKSISPMACVKTLPQRLLVCWSPDRPRFSALFTRSKGVAKRQLTVKQTAHPTKTHHGNAITGHH